MQGEKYTPSEDGRPYGTRNGRLIAVKDAIRMETVEQYRDARKAKASKKKAARTATKTSRKKNRK